MKNLRKIIYTIISLTIISSNTQVITGPIEDFKSDAMRQMKAHDEAGLGKLFRDRHAVLLSTEEGLISAASIAVMAALSHPGRHFGGLTLPQGAILPLPLREPFLFYKRIFEDTPLLYNAVEEASKDVSFSSEVFPYESRIAIPTMIPAFLGRTYLAPHVVGIVPIVWGNIMTYPVTTPLDDRFLYVDNGSNIVNMGEIEALKVNGHVRFPPKLDDDKLAYLLLYCGIAYPHLKRLSITYQRITEKSIANFGWLPNLSFLGIRNNFVNNFLPAEVVARSDDQKLELSCKKGQHIFDVLRFGPHEQGESVAPGTKPYLPLLSVMEY